MKIKGNSRLYKKLQLVKICSMLQNNTNNIKLIDDFIYLYTYPRLLDGQCWISTKIELYNIITFEEIVKEFALITKVRDYRQKFSPFTFKITKELKRRKAVISKLKERVYYGKAEK